jgi:glutamate synthase domain-containing protein 2
MSSRDLIDYAAQDDAVNFRANLYADIHDRVIAHIEAKKQEVAQGLLNAEAVVHEEEESKKHITPGKMKKSEEKFHLKKEEIEALEEETKQLVEGKMDHMSLSHLWHTHAKHAYRADRGWNEEGIGSHHAQRSEHAATAIENHVRKHHGNKVADDMVAHSDHHVADADYAGSAESKKIHVSAAKLRSKHGIEGDLYGNSGTKQ